MNYSKIDNLRLQKKVSIRLFSKAIGMSGPGYAKMIANQSCDVATLEAIAKYYKVPVSYFFEDETGDNEILEPETKYKHCKECAIKLEKISELQELLLKKDNELIDSQRNYISLMNEYTSYKGNRHCG